LAKALSPNKPFKGLSKPERTPEEIPNDASPISSRDFKPSEYPCFILPSLIPISLISRKNLCSVTNLYNFS